MATHAAGLMDVFQYPTRFEAAVNSVGKRTAQLYLCVQMAEGGSAVSTITWAARPKSLTDQ